MKIGLKNIGKVKETVVEINGITVIGGENGTGKSTVGKALFAVYNSQYSIDVKIKNDRIQSIVNFVKSNFYTNKGKINFSDNNLFHFADTLVTKREYFSHSPEIIKQELLNIIDRENVKSDTDIDKNIISSKGQMYSNLDIVALQLQSMLIIPDEELLESFMQKHLDSEFLNQISNVSNDEFSQIDLEINNNITSVELQFNSVSGIRNPMSLNNEIIYIDDPYMLDLFEFNKNLSDKNISFHRSHLISKFENIDIQDKTVTEEILLNKKLDNFKKIINEVCPGDVIKTKENVLNYKTVNEKNINFTNLSSGLKSFAIIKTLIQKGIIKNNDTIILDEPEIHLHPEWQLIYAQLIVLLNKEFEINILLNTHSPYFLRAIQVYAARYSIADKCKYYLSEIEDDYAVIKDVSNDIDKIYAKLAQPIQTLSDLEAL